MGSENKGIKKLLLDNCDFKVRINITKSTLIDSLNVSNAAAITMFELRKMKELPKFYDDLDLTLQEIEYLLSRGVKDRKSSFHYTMLCTINNKTPESRTVILRKFNKDKFELNIHSDLRSGKSIK